MGPLDFDIGGAMREAYDLAPEGVRQRDHRGFSRLHTAALGANLPAVQALFALPAESGVGADARARNNVAGCTPLGLCEQKVQGTREFTETLLGTWNGYDPDSLRVVLLLKRAAGEEIAQSEEEFIASRKWGCTCGDCTGGWLSMKMRYRLESAGLCAADTMETATSWAPRESHFDDETAAEYLPPHMRQGGISGYVFRDYAEVVRAIGVVLGRTGEQGIPSDINVSRALSGHHGSAFFYKGGTLGMLCSTL
ncbi:hypothetical protein C2E23DRAFT_356847 [Lenzites betulinus]|nr:hypothetical protein C2E23DRAFT_356847 [Lenzites betulinus]